MQKLRIDVWSDIACPWCYIGKRRLEAALARFAARDSIDLVWRAFELDASAPRALEGGAAYAERLAQKYGTSLARAEGMIAHITQLASQDGLSFDFDRIRPGNTFDAHRLLHFARERGIQDAVKERLLSGYLCQGAAIGDPEVLVELSAHAGLAEDEARAVLASDAYAREVRADEAEARTLGINGVPFFVLGDRYAVSGAQPAELLLRAIEQAWTEGSARAPDLGESSRCGPDGC
jgi:predicted DsbA family dithiol-disulfide isomerase